MVSFFSFNLYFLMSAIPKSHISELQVFENTSFAGLLEMGADSYIAHGSVNWYNN